MKKICLKLACLLLSFIVLTPASAQCDPVVMKINGKEVLASEFFYIYNKYHTAARDEKTPVRDYVPMFVDFRLKIEAALESKLDTLPAFAKELTGYRAQLSKQYLDPLTYSEDGVKAIYEQSKEVVEVSHILVKIPESALPADTLIAYKRALKIYDRLQNEPFEVVARDMSDDIGADPSKPGYMGFLHTTMTAKPFMDAAYATAVGKFAAPVRTYRGFHIIKVHSRKANPGDVLVAHIFLPAKGEELIAAKERIDSIYALVQRGDDFGELAQQYSQDTHSAKNKGELPWFGVRDMVPEFEEKAYALSPGEYTEPFQSRYGYHIVKSIAKRSYPSYPDVKEVLVKRIQQTDHVAVIKEPHLELLKEAYGFNLSDDTHNEIAKIADNYHPKDPLFRSSLRDLGDRPLFSAGDTTYMLQQYVDVIILPYSYLGGCSSDIVNGRFEAYCYEMLLKMEKENLDARFADFRNLMNEYHDGMLLFEVSNKEVWGKAGKDTEGLAKCFKQNKANYKWHDKKYKGFVVLCKDEAVKNQLNGYAKELSLETVDKIVKEHFNADSIPEAKVVRGLYGKGDNQLIDQIGFEKKKKDINLPDGYASYYAKGKLLAAPESYSDVRGLVVSDYQDELEKEWIKTLHQKYQVEIYWDVIDEYQKQN